MSKKKHILQLQNNFNVMSSDLAEQIIRALPADNYEVTTAFLKGKPNLDQQESTASQSVYFDFSQKELKGFRRWFAVRKIRKFCERNNFDAVICHRFKPTHIFLNLCRTLNTKAFISIAHGFGDYDRSYRQKLVNKRADNRWCFVGVSKPVQKYLVDTTEWMNDTNTVAINNAIDIEQASRVQLTRGEARKELNLPSNRFIFGTIGRLVEIKGHAVMLEAMALLKDQYPQAMVAIIGGGEEEAHLKQQVVKLGLESHVRLLGKRDEAIQYVKAFDVFTLPSFTEGLPLALLEGMSGGIPVIGSDIDTIKPLIEGIGQVFKVKDHISLKKCMEFYLDQKSKQIEKSGERHFNALCERHNINDFRAAYRNLLENMLKS